jgi:putative sterol carrier protein
MAMADPTSDFFERVVHPGGRRLGNVTASIRIDLDRGKATEHWLLVIDKGNISVSRKDVKADAALHTDKEIFDRLARGEASPLASMLRGLVQTEGDTELIVLFQGLFPAPRNPLSHQASADMEKQPA